MAAFDPKVYEETVVKPLRRLNGKLTNDLLSRYAVEAGMSDTELRRRLSEVRSHWNKRTLRQGPTGSVYKAMIKADEALKAEHGKAMDGMEWWRAHEQEMAQSRQTEITELASALRANFGELGLISQGQLDKTMQAMRTVLAPAEIDKALTSSGVRRIDPVSLPAASGLSGTHFKQLAANLIDADQPTVAHLVLGPVAKLRLLDGFGCEPAGSLDAAAVRNAITRENKRSDNQSAREALGVLDSAAQRGVDLVKLTLFHALQAVRDLRGAPVGALLRQLDSVGIDPAEARRIVFSVLAESTGGPAVGKEAVVALLSEGRLVAAQQAVAALAGNADQTAAKALVDQQLEQVRQLREAAQAALRRGTDDDALFELRKAVALASDDEELAAELRRVPPAPVLELNAVPDGSGVRVTWRPSPTHEEGTKYRLVRREGRAPGDAEDGVVVSDDTGTRFVDQKLPAGVRVGYAVFAGVDGGKLSRPAGAVIEVLPPVQNVVLSTDNGHVEAHWLVHPDVQSVEVRRGSDGVAISAGKASFHDRTAADGVDHVYTLVAQYRRSDGTPAASEPVVVRTTSHGRAKPVAALRAKPLIVDGVSQVVLSWRQEDDAEVTIRRATKANPWEFAAVVSNAALDGYGEEVVGRRSESGGWHTLTAAVPAGRFWYVPFTLGPSGAVCGQDSVLGVAPPVRDVTCQRMGDELALSWVWPDDVGVAAVEWVADGRSESLRLTRQQYHNGGGCHLTPPGGPVVVKVSSVLVANGAECLSVPVEVTVSEKPPRIRYNVEITKRRLTGGGTIRVLMTADQPVARCTVAVVAAQGATMPRSRHDGRVLTTATHQLAAGRAVELDVELPKLRRPYWVRCFLDGDHGSPPPRLIDPPVQQLKVS
jgi:hypothetical protein